MKIHQWKADCTVGINVIIFSNISSGMAWLLQETPCFTHHLEFSWQSGSCILCLRHAYKQSSWFLDICYQGLFTLSTVIVDYRGFRVIAQSIIPGKFWIHVWTLQQNYMFDSQTTWIILFLYLWLLCQSDMSWVPSILLLSKILKTFQSRQVFPLHSSLSFPPSVTCFKWLSACSLNDTLALHSLFMKKI